MNTRAWILATIVGAGWVGAEIDEAQAQAVEISARFDAELDVNKNQFEDTTNQAGLPSCSGIEAFCQDKKRIAFLTSGLDGFPVRVPMEGEQFPLIRLPGAVRDLRITGDNGQQFDLKFRMSGFMAVLWGFGPPESYENIGGPNGNCGQGAAVAAGTSRHGVKFGWTINNSDGTCFVNYLGWSGSDDFQDMYGNSFTYELIAPNPAALHSGTYTGQLVYSVGYGNVPGDIEFPIALNDSSDRVELNFTLTVRHDLKVDFPGSAIGAPVVAYLEPPGGWSAWEGSGTPPPQLWREVPFAISMSGPLKMSMECEYYIGAGCGISNGTDEEPIEVTVTIPGVNVLGGDPVFKTPLPTDRTSAIMMEPGRQLMAQRAAVNFRTDADATRRIAATPGAHYQGRVTLVFDADP
jgi:hypothetical protein